MAYIAAMPRPFLSPTTFFLGLHCHTSNLNIFYTEKAQPNIKFDTKEILKLKGFLDTLTKPGDLSNYSLTS